MFWVEPKTGFKVGVALYENRNKIFPLVRRVFHRVTHGKLYIAVFGPGGVGKSTLGIMLRGDTTHNKTVHKYNESIGTESYSYQGEVIGKIAVPPGQERRRKSTWTELYHQLSQAKSAGIINVVSWGYHSFQDLSYQDTKFFRDGMTKDEFLAEYLQDRRQTELEIIKDLVPRICDAKQKLWMITLVTKQDLWWNEREEVKQYYQEGEYASYIQQIVNARGSQNFIHEYLSASLVMDNFTSGTGELLAPTTAGYDHNLQIDNLSQFLEAVKIFAVR